MDYYPHVALSVLLLSTDAAVVQVLRPLLPELGMHTDQCATTDAARKMISAKKYEAIIVDVDISGASEFMASLRQLAMSRNSIIFSLTRSTTMTEAFQAGANFVLEKPLTSDRAMRSFRAAQGLIVRERRRYFRHPVSIRATLEYGNTIEEVTVANLSEGGMAIDVRGALMAGQVLKWKFELPEKHQAVEGKGEVSWFDSSGHAGIRFVFIPQKLKEHLEEWLRSREKGEPAPLFVNTNRSWNQDS
jgi:CheY-like chemotaxis protein